MADEENNNVEPPFGAQGSEGAATPPPQPPVQPTPQQPVTPPPVPPGATPPPAGTYYSNQQGYMASGPKNDGFAIASLVLGLCGLLSFCCCIFIVCAILGIVFGGISLNRINKSNGMLKGKGMALAGLITGIVGITLWLIYFAISIATNGFDLEYYSDFE